VLDHLAAANKDANPELMRLALKLATGAGKTAVMAMLVGRGLNGTMPVGSVPTLGSTFRASSSNSPARILRSRPVSIAAGERSQSSGAADVLTFMSRCDIADGQAARLRGTTLDALGSQVLVEALGDLHEQAG
jgi:hypothetical protein